ncbi:uncharacterized protein LOC143280244 [Babylonia areolata]|uniref:uncharacterized protein LOC143280244 n=1 Tax=Babylonia areolata TaxID=304850 RepID=UPI003FD2190F
MGSPGGFSDRPCCRSALNHHRPSKSSTASRQSLRQDEEAQSTQATIDKLDISSKMNTATIFFFLFLLGVMTPEAVTSAALVTDTHDNEVRDVRQNPMGADCAPCRQPDFADYRRKK